MIYFYNIDLLFSFYLNKLPNTKQYKINVTEADESFDSYLQTPIGTSYSQSTSLVVLPSPCGKCTV